MHAVYPRARLDWLIELGGASALALAIGFAGLRLAPSLAYPPVAAALASLLAMGMGLAVMRMVPPGARKYALPDFAIPSDDAGELLLDCPVDEPLLLEDVLGPDELLLDDPLDATAPGSQVVRLFDHQRPPTAGQLKERIDRHLATGTMHVVREFEGPAPDASDALYAALDELRRSLR
jgi:hypothetical protein